MLIRRSFGLFSVLLLLLLPAAGHGQTSSRTGLSQGKYAQEAVVIEDLSTNVVFENSGNFTREQTTRVRVQTDAGVKAWGLLRFPFQSASETLTVDYVRVHKPDGSIVITPDDNMQDLDGEITRDAPFYSDLREKHVAVKGLAPGDTLEFTIRWQSTKPLIPGEFWFEYDFQHSSIVLREVLQLRTPAERAVKVKGPQALQTVTKEQGAQVYTWIFSNLEKAKDPKEDQKKERQAALGRIPPPDVQISSFQSWDQVGRWYWNLQKERAEPSAAIRAKAAELTKGSSENAAKLNVLYKFVSTQYRYIGIAFGIGRYQPHAADDVLTNNYGDCKDKHTLLASLLQASGITIYPALVNSSRTLDPDIPSPAQFDHVIGYLPQANGAVWLDTTPEVAPVGFLSAVLRDKNALVILEDSASHLVTTPPDPPIASSQKFKLDAKLQDDGTLEATVEDTTQGENEVVIRQAFRQVPQPKWNNLVQQISYSLGFAGTVSDVNASPLEAIDDPFHFSYSYNRKEYPDWKNQQLTVPGLPFFMPPLRDDQSYPLWLGSPMETVSESRVELPDGYKPVIPSDVTIDFDFAQYRASYSRDHGTLIAKRTLTIKLHEVPAAEFQHYRDFLRSLSDDTNRYIQTSSSDALNVHNLPPSDRGASTFLSRVRELPDSSSSEANALEAKAWTETKNHDLPGAASWLNRAVAVDPKFARAWVFLAMVLFEQKQPDASTAALHKAVAVDPTELIVPKAFGFSLMAEMQFEQAVPVWQEFIKAHPEDKDGPVNLGQCLLKLHRNSEAVEVYEAALKTGKPSPELEISLGSAYLLAGERDKAAGAFNKLGALDSNGRYLKDAAYAMANDDLKLPLALDYAKKAARSVEEESRKTTLKDFNIEDFQRIFKIAAYWDTLGWVNERMSNLPDAERYLLASWKLTQDGVAAGHLCHLYERLHRTESAVHMCHLAISRMALSRIAQDYGAELAEAQENLNFLTAALGKPVATFDSNRLSQAQRTFKLPRFMPGTESAEFFVLFVADGKSKKFSVQDIEFISGSQKIKAQANQLRSIDFNVPAPSDAPVRFVWRGILGCYQYTGCSFAVLDPTTVNSVN
jgi:tetratricopeptide (TPR) repeat protein